MIDSSDTNTSFPNVKDNQLVVPALDRSHQGAVYICQASNNNISTPASTRVTVDMLREYTMFLLDPIESTG